MTLTHEPARLSEPGAQHWTTVVRRGGATRLPRWGEPAGSSPEWGRHEEPWPVGLHDATRGLAARLGVVPEAVLLAAHARVMAAMSGEPVVVVGLPDPQGHLWPMRLDTDARSWAGLARTAHRVLLASRSALPATPEPGGPEAGAAVLGAVAATLRRPVPVVETAVGVPADPDPDRGDGVLLVVATPRGLVLRHRTDRVDPAYAVRLAGYHLQALAALVAGPDDRPGGAGTLLSAGELDHQLHALSGPVRPVPEVGLHRLVEERVRRHPEAVAADHAGTTLTYGALNARANRLARALLDAGLTREGVVAVVTDRDLDWLTAALAVVKAGGAYLPLEPHFPAARMVETMGRAGACHLLTTSTAPDAVAEAVASLTADGGGVRRLDVDRLLAGPADPGTELDLAVDTGPEHLAYLYFTSGSTGRPKGAMCEQAGMLNHLLAKQEDLGLREGDVVAQVAPQCFDISWWQLVSALLVGGRTHLVEQDVVLDVARMVEGLAAARVAVLQVVPSYLEALMTHLERHPHPLPDLRVVSVTGEAVKRELVDRWFALAPGVTLVNAYGLTETSDDTNHAVMHGPPPGDGVPLGAPVRNVTVYVVDEALRPVPLGAPGEIVFSGVCVGRGYVHDPERTAAAFVPDPHRPGARLYRSGDFGRWAPDGSLEFLGRRDNQLKIAGFRIELGEVENALLGAPGVRDAAVVVTGDGAGGGARRLVGFASGDRTVEEATLRAHLSARLPHYMVPAVLHRRDALPLSDNGKIDRRALTALAADLAAGDQHGPAPTTPWERRVAAAWATALGIDAADLGPDDRFADRGGTSLGAVKVVVALDRRVSLRDVLAHPVLADLARVLAAADPGPA